MKKILGLAFISRKTRFARHEISSDTGQPLPAYSAASIHLLARMLPPRAALGLAVCCGALIFPALTNAESTALKRVKSDARVVSQKTKALKKNALKLKGAEKTSANTALKRLGLSDLDSDGVPDVLESPYGTNACDSTTDGEYLDGDKREREGRVTAASENSITVGGLQFILGAETVYEDIEQSELVVGACVSVEGYLNLIESVAATKVERYGRCRGGGGSSSSRSSSSSSGSSSSEEGDN
ncbi:MAG: hypothetical protein EBZ48_02090 [Proteobacteria bacterium]|nr:hypothetical protein [Pseudomonadota bacterium]